MSNVDEYEFRKSCLPQSLYKDQPCTDYQYNYINDINQSIYTNSSLTLVQYDLTSIYNSSRMTNLADHFLIIPTIRTLRATNGAAVVALNPQTAFAGTSLKNGNQCIIHQADLIIDGKTVVQLQPFHGILNGLDQISKMSNDDITLYGKIKGYAQQLDNPLSATYTGNSGQNSDVRIVAPPVLPNGTGTPSSPGIANNTVFGVGVPANNGSALNAATPFQSVGGAQNFQTVNGCLQEKLSWNVNTTGQVNNMFGTNAAGVNLLMPVNQLNQDFTPYSTYITATNTYVWYDFLTIKLSDILGPMDAIGYMRRFNAILRIYINTGLVSVSVSAPVANYKALTYNGPQYSTFTNVCPIMINNLNATYLWTGPAPIDPNLTFTDLTAGFFIGSTPNYSIQTAGGASVNFGGITSAITSTRYYYSSILLDPMKASDYLTSQQSKVCVSKEFLYNTYTNIRPGTNFSQLMQSGVKNITSVIIFPFIASSVNGFAQYQSPFDPAGGAGCTCPISLINIQIAIGGVNQLTNALTYSYESWIEQISKFNKSSSSEYGVESGLLNQNFWNYNKIYMANIRSTIDDSQTARNVTASFINNSNVAIDIMVFVVYEQELIVNCSTGAVLVK